VRVACDIAMKRSRRVCSVDKANVLETTGLWREVATRIVEADLPEIEALTHVRRQRRHAAGPLGPAVRRDGHRQHVRRHPVGRGSMLTGSIGHAAVRFARRQRQGVCTKPIHGSRRTSQARGSRTRSRPSCRLAMMLRYSARRARTGRSGSTAGEPASSTPACAHRTSSRRGRRRVGTEAIGDAIVAALA